MVCPQVCMLTTGLKKILIVCPFLWASFDALHQLVHNFPLYWWGHLFEALALVTDWYQLASPSESTMLKWSKLDGWILVSSLLSRTAIDDEWLLTSCWAFSGNSSSSSSIQIHASLIYSEVFVLPFTSSGVWLLVALWHLWVTVLERFFLWDIVEFLGCPISLFLMVYAWVFFSPLACWPKLETKQEQSNVMWSVFQIQWSSKVKISWATVLTKIHLLVLAQHFS